MNKKTLLVFDSGIDKKKFLVLIFVSLFLISFAFSFVSAEKLWNFHNYTVNISDDLYFGGYIYGDGSYLTNLNVSELNLSDYIPYTGSSANVALGLYNFSINTSDFFVNSNTGNVGIGTIFPKNTLNVLGTANVISNMTISGMTIYQKKEDMVFRI